MHVMPDDGPNHCQRESFRDSKWSETEVKIDGEELMIMKESDIMGLIEGGASAAKTS